MSKHEKKDEPIRLVFTTRYSDDDYMLEWAHFDKTVDMIADEFRNGGMVSDTVEVIEVEVKRRTVITATSNIKVEVLL